VPGRETKHNKKRETKHNKSPEENIAALKATAQQLQEQLSQVLDRLEQLERED
jgi:hypothetical protein